MGKHMIAYFSHSNNTKEIAQILAAVEHGDLFEIKAAVPYTDSDTNWLQKNSRVALEQKDSSCRPKIIGPLPDLTGYTELFVGFPIWLFDAPRVIYTFLDAYGDCEGLTVIPFATSGGSGHKEADKQMRSLLQRIRDMRPVSVLSEASRPAIIDWHKRMRLED